MPLRLYSRCTQTHLTTTDLLRRTEADGRDSKTQNDAQNIHWSILTTCGNQQRPWLFAAGEANSPHLCLETPISRDFHSVQRKGLLAPVILIASTEALKGLRIVPEENCAHLLRNGGLPGIIFPHATRRAPLAYGH